MFKQERHRSNVMAEPLESRRMFAADLLATAFDYADGPLLHSGGSQAALSGAEIRYVVGESLKSQWLIVAKPSITKPDHRQRHAASHGELQRARGRAKRYAQLLVPQGAAERAGRGSDSHGQSLLDWRDCRRQPHG